MWNCLFHNFSIYFLDNIFFFYCVTTFLKIEIFFYSSYFSVYKLFLWWQGQHFVFWCILKELADLANLTEHNLQIYPGSNNFGDPRMLTFNEVTDYKEIKYIAFYPITLYKNHIISSKLKHLNTLILTFENFWHNC